MKTIGKMLMLGFGVLVVLYIIGTNAEKNHHGSQAGTAAAAYADAPAPVLPPAERQLVDIVQRYSSAYEAAANDMAKGVLRAQRASAICGMINRAGNLMASPWVGTVATLSSSNSGKGVLSIQLADGVVVHTTNNDFSESLSDIKTLLQPGSQVSNVAAQLSVGQTVSFTGRFGRSEKDCLEVTDLTLEGALTEPEFTFQFASLRAAG